MFSIFSLPVSLFLIPRKVDFSSFLLILVFSVAFIFTSLFSIILLPSQNVAEICVWSSSQCDESGVDEYLHKLKNEQLKNVCKGDFLWAFSSCIDKKDPPNSPRISSRIPNHENRPVFVCVTENRNSTFEESIGGGFELDEDDQGNDFAELRVFDGQDVSILYALLVVSLSMFFFVHLASHILFISFNCNHLFLLVFCLFSIYF